MLKHPASETSPLKRTENLDDAQEAGMPFWDLYYHIVWTTKYRQPILTLDIEKVVLEAVNQKSLELGSPVLALNTVSDHIHVAVSIAPRVAVATWVGQVKGLSAHAVNAAFANLETPFKWQEGYGAISFGQKQLEFVENYIAAQKMRHAEGNIFDKLERVDD
jgi:REP element-mobilizing transposase RayT